MDGERPLQIPFWEAEATELGTERAIGHIGGESGSAIHGGRTVQAVQHRH